MARFNKSEGQCSDKGENGADHGDNPIIIKEGGYNITMSLCDALVRWSMGKSVVGKGWLRVWMATGIK